jgi:hypothetical protein
MTPRHGRVRLFPLSSVFTRSLLPMPWGPADTDKTASEQRLLDAAGSPLLIAQEIAAWAISTEITRGVTRDAALTAAPARKGCRAGQPVRYATCP